MAATLKCRETSLAEAGVVFLHLSETPPACLQRWAVFTLPCGEARPLSSIRRS